MLIYVWESHRSENSNYTYQITQPGYKPRFIGLLNLDTRCASSVDSEVLKADKLRDSRSGSFEKVTLPVALVEGGSWDSLFSTEWNQDCAKQLFPGN